MGMDPYGALLTATQFGRAIGARDPRSFGATLGASTEETIKGLMIQQELEKQKKAQEEAEKGSVFGKIGSVLGMAAGAAIPGVPILGPAIGSALGGTAGSAIGGGDVDLKSTLGYGMQGAMQGLSGQALGVGQPAAPVAAPQAPAQVGVAAPAPVVPVAPQPQPQPQVQVQPLAPVQTATPSVAQTAPMIQQDLTAPLLAGAAGAVLAPPVIGLAQDFINPPQPASTAPGATAQQAQNPMGGVGVAQAQQAPNAFPNLSQANPWLGQFANNFRQQLLPSRQNFAEQATGQVGIANPTGAPLGLGAILSQAQNYLFNDANSIPAMKPRYGLGPQDVALLQQTLQGEQQLKQQGQAQQDQIGVANRELDLRQQQLGIEAQRLNQPDSEWSSSGDVLYNKRTGQTMPIQKPRVIQDKVEVTGPGGELMTILQYNDGTQETMTRSLADQLLETQLRETANPSSRANVTAMQERGQNARTEYTQESTTNRYNTGQQNQVGMFNAAQANQDTRLGRQLASREGEGQANRQAAMARAKLAARTQQSIADTRARASQAAKSAPEYADAQMIESRASQQAQDDIKYTYDEVFSVDADGKPIFNLAGNPDAIKHYPLLSYGHMAPAIIAGALPPSVADPILGQALNVMKDPANVGRFGIQQLDDGSIVYPVGKNTILSITQSGSVELYDALLDKTIPLSPGASK